MLTVRIRGIIGVLKKRIREKYRITKGLNTWNTKFKNEIIKALIWDLEKGRRHCWSYWKTIESRKESEKTLIWI